MIPTSAGFDIKIRAQLLRDFFSRLIRLLEVYCGGNLLIQSERINEIYIKLRLQIEEILSTDGFETLSSNYHNNLVPDSLIALGTDAGIDWEYGIQTTLYKLKGEIIEFCIRIGAEYDNEKEFQLILGSYDKAIDSFLKFRQEEEEKFFEEFKKNIKPQDIGALKSEKQDVFVEKSRKEELEGISKGPFDLARLIEMCNELNSCFSIGNYLAVAMLTRAILDHVPPIFGYRTFSEVANNYRDGGKSFKHSMLHLDNSSRNIADACLHVQIRNKESLPTKTQVDFRSDLDLLLSEIVRILK